MSHTTVSDALQDLYQRGYAVFERAYSEEEVAFLRNGLVSAWEDLDRPSLRGFPPRELSKDAVVGPAGLVLLSLTSRYPHFASRLFKPQIIQTIRELLGNDMQLELSAGTLSDSTRPFFDWHVHIGGADDAFYDYKRPYPLFEHSERVTHILYLDDLNEDNGKLVIYPRKLTDPTVPPFEKTAEHWPGEIEVACPSGSVVILEQCTWHAARQKKTDGLRAFIGSYFASKDAVKTPLADQTLYDWNGSDELFRSIVPRRQ